MSNFDRLTGMIREGELELIHVEAVPRSVSTALARALSESDSPSIYVNEPFNRMKHDMEDASMRILQAVDSVPSPVHGPLTVVAKNMARNISQPIFDELVEISKGIVWSVRHPHIQISSLLTRVANDLEFEAGASKLTMEELTDSQILQASEFLENGPKSTNFSKTSWEDIGRHFSLVGGYAMSVVVDGTELTKEPVRILSGAARILGLPYSDSMVSGWQGAFINANTGYNPNLTDETHGWTKDAVISRGIQSSSQRTIDLERLPHSLREHLSQVAIPTYKKMIDEPSELKSI